MKNTAKQVLTGLGQKLLEESTKKALKQLLNKTNSNSFSDEHPEIKVKPKKN
jgi:hypothetical protein